MGDDYFPRRSRTAYGWTFEGSRLGEQLGPLGSYELFGSSRHLVACIRMFGLLFVSAQVLICWRDFFIACLIYELFYFIC